MVLFDFGSRGLGGRCGHREDPAAGSRFDHGVQFLSVGPNDAKQWKETWLWWCAPPAMPPSPRKDLIWVNIKGQWWLRTSFFQAFPMMIWYIFVLMFFWNQECIPQCFVFYNSFEYISWHRDEGCTAFGRGWRCKCLSRWWQLKYVLFSSLFGEDFHVD